MLISILVYGFLGVSLWWLGTQAAKRERINLTKGNGTIFWTWELFLSLLLFALVSGLRWNVGADHLNYISNYETLKKGWEISRIDFESGFIIISKVFALLNAHFTLYFGFWAFMQLFFVYYAFKSERFILQYLGLFILFGGQYFIWMNGIRQALSACIFVFSIQFIINKSFLKYLITIGIATLFHQSAIILIVIYFIPNREFFSNKYITSTILILSIFLGENILEVFKTSNFENFLLFIGYDKYANNLDHLLTETKEMMIFGPRRIVTTLLNLAIIWSFPKMYSITKSKKQLLCYNLAIFGAIYFNLFANAGHIVLRPTYYFLIFTPIIVAYILSFLKIKIRSNIIPYLIILILALSYLLIAIYAENGKGISDFTNYKFFWNYTQMN